MPDHPLPLSGTRVLEIGGGKGELATRYLADLGADVVLVEEGAGSPARSVAPVVDGVATYHEAFNANKRSIVLDLSAATGRETFEALLSRVDIVFSSYEPAALFARGIDLVDLHERHPHLVVTAFTDFGLTGPWRDWIGTEWLHLALGGTLARSGAPGREPLMPPMSTASQNAAIQAAWATLVGHTQRVVRGHGDLVDVAVLEAVAQVSDPPFGMAGSAAGGVPTAGGPRGRVDWSFRYPYYPAADGWVRLAILSPRQWAGMFEWLGRPEAYAAPHWSLLGHRYDHYDELRPAIAALVSQLPCEQVIAEAARHGLPAASVLSPDDVLTEPHFAARGVFGRRSIGDHEIVLPRGPVELDGDRIGIRTPAPALGQHTDEVLAELTVPPLPPLGASGPLGAHGTVTSDLPLAGVRVLDFGVIVAGGEAGRLLADLGADVIKVENLAVPDGSRQSIDGSTINVLFAWGNRNKRSVGIDVKSPEGTRLIHRLVEESDVVLSNFKPGTLAKLGLSYEQLRELNPGIVTVESSAFGHTGPWAVNPGYGPVVRSAVGISHLWRYHDDPTRFFDDVTSYPDHAAARTAVTSVVAKLLGRRSTGRGGSIHIAQTEVSLWQHSHLFAGVSLAPGSLVPIGNVPAGDLPGGVFAAEGDDEWVVVDVRTPAQRDALVAVLEQIDGGRWAPTGKGREQIENALRRWLPTVGPDDAMVLLQENRVPAGKMMRAEELLELSPLVARGTFRTELHPLVADPMPSEGAPALFRNLPRVTVTPAPVLGQHTREVMRSLGLDDHEIEALIAVDVLQEDAVGISELQKAELTVARRPAGGGGRSKDAAAGKEAQW